MPGAYAHLTLVDFAANPNRRKNRVTSMDCLDALDYYPHFSQLGAVSPDYPYLDAGDSAAVVWADVMHHDHTLRLLRAGVGLVSTLQGDTKKKCLAWLLGFASHMAADVTIHPVVEFIVGPYRGNERDHRICEFHQDAYIWQRKNLGEDGMSAYMHGGIAKCSDLSNKEALDTDVAGLWRAMLEQAYPKMYKQQRPNVDGWHDGFHHLAADLASNGYRLLPFIRNLGVVAGLTYPDPDKVNKARYIDALETPNGSRMGYDDIFNRAIDKAVDTWAKIDDTLTNGTPLLAGVDTWDLDSGRSEGPMIVW